MRLKVIALMPSHLEAAWPRANVFSCAFMRRITGSRRLICEAFWGGGALSLEITCTTSG